MSLFIGYDIGSRTGKAVVIDEKEVVVYRTSIETLGNALLTYEHLTSLIPKEYLVTGVKSAVTGYGREALGGIVSCTATEITCHTLGVLACAPHTATIIDIGGQDAKVISVEDRRVRDFVMNDRCAAGAGRFLEVIVPRLGFSIEEFCSLDVRSITPPLLSSTCTVFAESEVVSLMAAGVPPLTVAAAVADMAARMVSHLAMRIPVRPPFFMTGGVSRAIPVRHYLSKIIGAPIATSTDALFTGAHGAALLLLKGQ